MSHSERCRFSFSDGRGGYCAIGMLCKLAGIINNEDSSLEAGYKISNSWKKSSKILRDLYGVDLIDPEGVLRMARIAREIIYMNDYQSEKEVNEVLERYNLPLQVIDNEWIVTRPINGIEHIEACEERKLVAV